MQRDPSKRPSPADVLQHPWLCEAAPDQPLEQVGACATIWRHISGALCPCPHLWCQMLA